MMLKPGQTLIGQRVLFVLLLFLSMAWALPVLWMISTSLKSESEIFTLPMHWIPWKFTLEHYMKSLTVSHVARWFWNSVIVSASETLLTLLIASLAAYAFARIRFFGRNVLFMVVLSTMMIPAQVTLIPTYLLLSRFMWVNTFQGVIAPGLAGAFGIFLLKQFFEGIPLELEDAAKLDGYGRIGIFMRIIIPLSIPAVTALGIFTALGTWNNFLWPLIVLQDTKKMTLPVGLAVSLQGTYATSNYGVLMAAAFIASAPILLVYLVFQDKIIKGVTITGIIKG
jgi:multiple sugar transport system permease protein